MPRTNAVNGTVNSKDSVSSESIPQSNSSATSASDVSQPSSKSMAEELNAIRASYQEEFVKPIISFPILQVLNTERERFGLFLKEDEQNKAIWTASESFGIPYTHVYKTGGSEKVKGKLFQQIAMHIIDVSARLIEMTDAGMRAYIGGSIQGLDFLAEKGIAKDSSIKKPIIGIYADKEGQLISNEMRDFYGNLKANGWVTLRTYYLVKLLEKNPDGSFTEAHKTPFCFSVHGASANSFGQALTKLGMSFSSLLGLDMQCLNVAGISNLVFEPTFCAELAGSTENTSYVTAVESFTNITEENLHNYYRKEVVDVFKKIRQANNNFAYHYAVQCANSFGVNQVVAGLNFQQPSSYILEASYDTELE